MLPLPEYTSDAAQASEYSTRKRRDEQPRGCWKLGGDTGHDAARGIGFSSAGNRQRHLTYADWHPITRYSSQDIG